MDTIHGDDSSQGIEMFGTPDSQTSTFEEEDGARSFFVRALYDFNSNDSSSLSFGRGALIEVLTQLESGWWDGLLGNDVRGWFPSNYVEVITDEEAEMELAAREGDDSRPASPVMEANKSGGSTHYGGLGLGQDFDVLRQLIHGVSGMESNDAFEQLAEAGMRENSGQEQNDNDGGSNRARTSNVSGVGSSTTPSTQTGSNYISSRSMSESLNEDEGQKYQNNSTASSRLGPSEKERLRAHTVSVVTPGQQGETTRHQGNGLDGRPRASTNITTPQFSNNSNNSNGNKGRRGSQKKKNESDFWVPRVTERGEIIYFNTRTGAQSHDLPDGTEMGVEGEETSGTISSEEESGEQGEEEEEEEQGDRIGSSNQSFGRQSAQSSVVQRGKQTLLGRHTSVIYADAEGSRSRATSLSRPSTTASKSGRNGIENMPDPRDVPWPWVPRASDDERTFFFYNRQTHEVSHDMSMAYEQGANGSVEEATNLRRRGPRKSRATTMDSNDTSHRGGGGVEDDYHFDSTGPFIRHSDEQEAVELQNKMSKLFGSPLLLHETIDTASHAINRLASIASESVASDGLSELDRKYMFPISTSTLADSSRLGSAIALVVTSIRNLLYSAGSLAVSETDLSIASELAWLFPEQGTSTSDVFTCFQTSLMALHSKSQSHSEPLVAAALTQARQIPPSSLTTMGKKINATLSKLVLSARSVIEQSCLNTSTRPELTTAQLDKIGSYRRRIQDDSMELARALDAFGVEADRSRLGGSMTNIIPWARQVEGSLKSGRGMAGIGLEMLGGGAAAGWRGNGFVLPSVTEAAALRAEALGSYQNPFELTRDARNALSSGKISLRRKPTNVLSRRGFEEKLVTPFKQLTCELGELHRLIQEGESVSLTNGDDNKNPSTNGSQSPFTMQLLSHKAEEILSNVGRVLFLVEELDMATALDVDGPTNESETMEDDEEDIDGDKEAYMESVEQARKLLQQLTSVKQEMYDVSNHLFLEVQEVGQQVASQRYLSMTRTMINEAAKKVLITLLTRVKDSNESLHQVISKLVELSERQAKKGGTRGQIGARSKVYGIDEVKLSASGFKPVSGGNGQATRTNNVQERVEQPLSESQSGTSAPIEEGDQSQEDVSEQRDDVMYLGPGLAVPNGPPASSRASSSTSLLGNLSNGLRARSMSVATGASVNSHDSGSRSTRRGGGGGDDDDTDLTRKDSKVNNKIKRFFGDDAPSLQSIQTGRDSTLVDSMIETPTSATSTTTTTTTTTKVVEETPWFLQVDYSEEDIVMNPSGHVKGATLGALMERLTMHNAFDANFNTTFLMTYRSFTSTEELLDLLADRFAIKEPSGLTKEEHQLWTDQKQMLIRFRIFNVLKTWLEAHFYEGEDEVYLQRVENFVLDGMGQSPILATPGKHLIRLIERRSGKGEKMVRKFQLPSSTPTPILPKNFRKIKFLDIDPLEMARQLTLIDSRLYNRIRPVECLGKAWSRENGLQVAKGIRDVISANNKVSGWVSEAILVQEDLKKRAAWVKQFVAIADRCFALNNFSSMMAIYSGLNNASLNRLRRTWDAVNQRHLQMFENMKNILAPTRNFSKYRETLRRLNPPCVPFLGVYLTDLTFIEDGNSDRLKTDERLINFSKRQMTADKIQEIMIYQSTPYNLTPVPSIQKFIEENLIDSRRDEELFEQSLRLEPREREDEKIARLLQESGFL